MLSTKYMAQIAKFMGPTWGPPGSCRPQIGPMLAPWTLLSAWWRHQMETFFVLLALCAGNSLVPSEFPAQRPVTQSFDVFFDLHLNKRLSKQWWGWWFEMPSSPLWRHCNEGVRVGVGGGYVVLLASSLSCSRNLWYHYVWIPLMRFHIISISYAVT